MSVLWLGSPPFPDPVGIHCIAVLEFGFPALFPRPDEMGSGVGAAARSRIGEPALKHGLPLLLCWRVAAEQAEHRGEHGTAPVTLWGNSKNCCACGAL